MTDPKPIDPKYDDGFVRVPGVVATPVPASTVALIRDTLGQAAANTADTALIAETARRVDAVLAEGLQHHLFLGRVLGKVRM